MKYRFLLAILVLVSVGSTAVAQNYSFSVPQMELHVTVNPDASVTMNYDIVFHCNTGAHPIDIVDIGLPHEDYDISNMQATLNDAPLSTIRKSEEIDIGVEVPLSPAIQPGERGRFEFECTMPHLVYQDTTDADYASLRIGTTWWPSQFVTGTTDLAIVVYLPDSIELDEILHQGLNFEQKMQIQGQKAVAWGFRGVRVDTQHMVGVSFPNRVMDRVVSMTKLGLWWKWWTDSPGARIVAGLLFLVLFGIFFFRLTGGTGACVFIPVLIGLAISWIVSPVLEAIFLPVLIPVWIIAERSRKGRQHEYLPAIASVPGGGIKRGLVVPEAAVTLEQPLGRVFTLVIFGLLKKGLVRQTVDDPLTLELPEEYKTTYKERREIAKQKGTVIRGYEQRFLDVIGENPGQAAEALDFREAMKHLVENTAKRMKGFDLEQTREYYRSIMAKAWEEARARGDLAMRTAFVDDNLMWLMLDEGYGHEFDTWHRGGYYYHPVWTRPAPAPAEAAPAPAAPGA